MPTASSSTWFGLGEARAAFDDHLAAVDTSDTLVMDERARDRVFNLGYFTWVEQQGVDVADFEARRSQEFWRALRPAVDEWDEMIAEFNGRTGVAATGTG